MENFNSFVEAMKLFLDAIYQIDKLEEKIKKNYNVPFNEYKFYKVQNETYFIIVLHPTHQKQHILNDVAIVIFQTVN